jgi:mevalonate kinase
VSKKFCSKIILFGEYALIQGSKAIAIPYSDFSGRLCHGSSDAEIEKFLKYLLQSSILSSYLDFDRIKKDLENGLFFESNIPQGSGLGSSGALCAAIFGEYLLKDDLELSHIRDLLALMESYYHGTSSGIDPLISYVGRPLMIEKRNQITEVEIPNSAIFGDFALVDSGLKRKTAPLVHKYIKHCEDGSIPATKLRSFIQHTTGAVDSLVAGNKQEFFNHFLEISRFQYTHLSDFIPNQFKEIWLRGIEEKTFLFKFCGAGGGGHFILYAPHKAPLQSINLNLMFINW